MMAAGCGGPRRKAAPAPELTEAAALAAYHNVIGAIRSDRAGLGRCYKASLKRRPELQGRAVIKLDLEVGGRARQVSVELGPSLQDAGLRACLEVTLAGLSYGQSPKPMKVETPIFFRADEDEPLPETDGGTGQPWTRAPND